MPNELSSLQNGSDIRGVALKIPGGPEVNLTPDAVFRIGAALVEYLAEKMDKPPQSLKIGVGHDSRLTAESLSEAALNGIASAGASAYYCALASTPSMFFSTVLPETDFDGAVMITASHLPMERNGLKLFDKSGGFDKADIKAVLELAGKIEVRRQSVPLKNFEAVGLIDIYAEMLCKRIKEGVGAKGGDKPLKGLHIIVDAGNGAGGFFAAKVLEPLGADTAGSQFLSPDGKFPNHMPNPENKEAMASAKAATTKSKADLGLIFDTDVDRMSAVLPDGSEVNRDAIIAMIAAVIAPDYPNSTVVTDSVTSDRLTRFLQDELKLIHRRFKRGYKNVINEGLRLNAAGVCCPLAIETSGHGALKENYFLDDGAYLAVKLVIALARAKKEGKPLASLIERLEPLFEAREYRIPVLGDDFAETGKKALELFEERAKKQGCPIAQDSFEGVRLNFPFGWAMIRMSLHEPLLPVNIEGHGEGDCERLCETVKELLSGVDNIDISIIK